MDTVRAMSIDDIIGCNVRRLREKAGMTQADLCRAMGMIRGCKTATNLSQREQGHKTWSAEQVAAAAQAFELTPESLYEPHGEALQAGG